MKNRYLYIFVIPFLGAVGFAIFKPIVPIWIKEISSRSIYAGLSASLFMIGRALMSPLGGFIHDRGFSVKKLLIFSSIFTSIVLLLFPFLNSIVPIFILSTFWGVFSGILWPQLQLITGKSAESSRRSRSLTIYYIAGIGGVTIGNGILGIISPFFIVKLKNYYV